MCEHVELNHVRDLQVPYDADIVVAALVAAPAEYGDTAYDILLEKPCHSVRHFLLAALDLRQPFSPSSVALTSIIIADLYTVCSIEWQGAFSVLAACALQATSLTPSHISA